MANFPKKKHSGRNSTAKVGKAVRVKHGVGRRLVVKEPKIVLFNKPMNVLCQFTGQPADRTLADFIPIKGIYAAGRLDKDSEGLLVLTNDGRLQHRITHPNCKLPKTYWVQVEGKADSESTERLTKGVRLKDGLAKAENVKLLDSDCVNARIWPRNPPIRYRAHIPTTWLALTLREGRNRQVRRMTAAVGLPTLRLIRVAVGPWQVWPIEPGDYQVLRDKEIKLP